MWYDIKYNPNKDIKPVSPSGSLDLKAAFVNNAIPANLQADDGKFNGIDDPASIVGRVTDRVDAEMCDRAIKGYKAPDNTE